MLRNALFTKVVCITTIYAFGLTVAARPAMAQARLSPMSFNQMYELAHDGDVESLRASNYRGMNIDATNGNGDTGLCLAARRRDVHAYNAFVAAGANPYHPCTQRISGYSAFVSRNDVIGNGAAQKKNAAGVVATNSNDSKISPIWWWIGGGAVAAAVIWALASGGGGGGGGSSSDSEAYNSLGRYDTTNGVAVKVTSGIMKNNQVLRHSNKNIEKIVNIDVRKSLADTTYMDAILYVKGGGSYINMEDILLEVGPGTIGMTAIEKGYVTNNGYIKVESYNASGGMVASESSKAINYGKGIIAGDCSDGIALNFSGYKANDTIFGMYADTNSSIYNYGDIKGSAITASDDPLAKDEDKQKAETSSAESSGNNDSVLSEVSDALTTSDASSDSPVSASVGTMIGMEALIVNMGSKLNQDTINVTNYSTGKIYLSAGDSGTTESEIKVSLVGMGSYLHNDFLNKSYSLSRAENVVIANMGVINLSYSGNYTSSSATALRKGLGGVVGIRADANTDAKNFGTIKITLFDEYDKEVEVAAGMQSVHGGNLANSGTITIYTPSENKRINYGMNAVEGTGNNSSLYANINPTLLNSSGGKINIQIGNSYGMASYVGGTVKNAGTIVLGSAETRFSNNIAMYGYGKTKRTELVNTGTIDIYSHKSMAMQNDYSGGTDITNDGTINIHDSATDSFVFGGAYSNAYNKGVINYSATATNPGEIAKEGVTYDPFKNYSISLGTSVISTKARTLNSDSSEFSSSTTEGIYNEEGAEINLDGSSFVAAMAVEANNGADTTQAKAVNNGKITIKDANGKNTTNTIGMYMDAKTLSNAGIINNGTILTDSNFSIAMVSESQRYANIINNGLIQASHENSVGMYATDYSNIQNNKDILIGGRNSIGVYVGVPDTGETERQTEQTDHESEAASSEGDSSDSIISTDTSSDSTEAVLKPKFVNAADAKIVVGAEDDFVENSYGVYGQAQNASGSTLALQVENNGVIDVYTKNAGAAIYTKGDGVKITNKKDISVFGDNSYGIYTGGKSVILNNETGVISVGTEQRPTSDSIAIINEGAGTKITNKGEIHLYNKSEDKQNYAIYSTGADTEIKNEQGGNIYLHNDHATGVYAEHGSIINNSTINIENDYSNAFEIGEDAKALNDTKGVINVGSEDKGVNHSNGLISLSSATGNIINKGEINLWNDAEGEGDSHAILAGGNITVTNEKTGKINSYYDNSDIIRATGNVTVINNGTIYGEGNNVSAIQGFDEDGKEASQITVENTKTGTITIGTKGTNKTEGYGIEANNIKTISNRGAITVHNKNSYGISAKKGESIVNDEIVKKYGAKIKMTGDNSVGIDGGAVANITNNGIIETFGQKSKAISTSTLDENGEQQESASQTITNTGDLILHNANGSYGIYALGNVSINSTRTGSVVIGYDEYGMPIDGSAKDAYGIFAEKASNITNDSLIKIYASGNAITGGESITNTGKLYLYGHYSTGIDTNGSAVTNSGAITIDGAKHSYGIHAHASGTEEAKKINITNKADGEITIGTENSLGTGSHGIYATEAGTIQNDANITVYARDASGITGGETIKNKGNILIGGQNSKGISSNGTSVENEGEITVKQAQDSYGIYTKHDTNQPTVTNKSTGKIVIGTSADCTPGDTNCAYNGHGIYAENAQSVTNYSDITVYAQQASGITGGQEIKNYSNNGKSGAIHIVGRNSNAIFGNKNNTSIYNEGKINVDDANGSFGIHASDVAETSVQNKTGNATITIGTENGTTGTSAHGIYAVKAGSITNEADITVYAQGDPISTVKDSLEFLPLKASGITGGATISNLGVIHITGGEAHGIYGAVNNTSITNNNNIEIDVAKYSYGIRAANTAATTIVNKPIHQSDNLTIVVGNENSTGLSSHGIFAAGAGSITNEAAITVYAAGTEIPTSGEDDALERLTYKASGITGGQSITNTGTIRVTGGNAHGIYGAANNTAITNSNNIKIDVADFSFGIRAYKTAATTISNQGNNLSIVVGDETEQDIGISSHGIFALAANSIINEAAISVYAAGQDFETTGTDDSPDVLIYKSSGITGGVSITNSGVIYLTGGKAHGIYGASNNTAINNSNRIRIATAQDSYGIRTSDSANTVITNTGDDLTIIVGTKDSTEEQTNGHGIYSKNATTITNDANIDVYAKESTGITGGKTITNNGKIHITGQDSKAIESGNATQITNSGTLTLDQADNSYGIYVDKSAAVNITNNADATIKIGAVESGINGHGIYAEGASSILNHAEITVDSEKASGITGGQSITNNGKIHLTGKNSKGIEGANEKTATISNTGRITIDDAQDSYGIYTVDDAKPTITNSSIATILIGKPSGDDPIDYTNPNNYAGITNGHGIYSSNATSITNDADISVYARGNGGDIFASGITGGQTLANSGTIIVAGNYGHALQTSGTSITNNGTLTVYGPNFSAGIYSTGSGVSIDNLRTSNKIPNITIGSNDYRGNEESYGIFAKDAVKVTNDGTIMVYADNSYGIYSRTNSAQVVENRGDIYMPEDHATGIYTRGSSTIDNKRAITIEKATDSYGIHSVGTDTTSSNVTNSEDGIIIIGDPDINATGAYGIYLDYGGSIRNDGMITIYASQSYGIYNTDGSSIINNALISLPQGDRSIGIFSAGQAMITNNTKGHIVIGSETLGQSSHGIKSMNAQGVNNKANITVYSTQDSTAISGGGDITNSGLLYVEGTAAKGIYSVDSTGEGASGKSSVNNSNTITVSGRFTDTQTIYANNSFGIYATGDVTITNSGNIIVGKEGKEAYAKNVGAIYTVKGTSLENSAILRVYAQDPAWGIYGGKVQALTNSGEIHMYGQKNIIGIYTGGQVKINNSGPITLDYANGNYGILSRVGPADITNSHEGIINVGNPTNATPTGSKKAYGIYADNAGTVSNAAKINVYGSESFGIWTDVVETLTNSGPITVPYGEKSGGIYSAQGKNITNSQLGKIIVGYPEEPGTYGTNELGIYAPKSETLDNQADINLYGQGVAITGHNQLKNIGVITIDNTDISNAERASKGIYSDGDSIDNDSTGKIDIYYSNGSIGIDSSGQTDIGNKADITIGSKETSSTTGTGAYGIRTTVGKSIDNSGTIVVNAKKSTGIYSNNSADVTNSGNITIQFGDSSIGIDSYGGSANLTNSGKIQIATATSNAGYGGNIGIRSSGSLAKVTNQANGTITIAPTGSLQSVNSKNYGLYVTNAESLENYADVNVNTDNSYAIYTSMTSQITNIGQLIVTGGKGSRGIYSGASAKEGINVINNGAIAVASLDGNASNSSGIELIGGSAEVSNTGSITVGNQGSISSSGLLGIKIQSGNITNDGAITLYGSGTVIEGNDSTLITNSKDLTLNGSGTGIHSSSGDITNSGNITINGDGYGINTQSEGTVTNKGTITVNSGYGILGQNYTTIIDNQGVLVIRAKGSVVTSASRVTNSRSAKMVVQGQGADDFGAVDARESVTNEGIIGTKNGNAITRASSVTNTETGTIEVKYDTSIGGGPFDLIKYDDQTGGIVVNNGYMHTEYGAIVRAASSVTNGKNSLMVVNGDESKDLELNPLSNASVTAPEATPVFEDVTTIYNEGTIKNYYGQLAIGTKLDTITNKSDILIHTCDEHNGAKDGIIQGNLSTVTNDGNILHMSEEGNLDDTVGIMGPWINGSADTVTNSGYVHVKNEKGVFIGNFGTVTNNGGTIKNDNGPIIDSRQNGNVGTLTNTGTLERVGGGLAIYKEGSFNLYNGGGTIIGDVEVVVPNSDTKVTIDNEGGKIDGALKITKKYSFIYRKRSTGTDTYEYYWTPDDDGTTVNPGETTSTTYCWDSNKCLTAENYDKYVMGELTFNGCTGLQENCHYFEPVYQEHSPSTASASTAVARPIKLSNGKTVNVVMLDGSEPDIEAIEKTLAEQETVTAMHNSLIWTDDADVLKNISITNSGDFKVDGDVHFGNADDESAYVSVGKDGSYEADSFAGKLRVESSVVQGGYDTTYVNENTLVGENNGVEFVSQSYMFDASSQTNENGNTDVVMTMKPFTETIDDAQLSELLATNYAAQHGEKVFDLLKTAASKQQLYRMTRHELGYTFVPNLAKQSLDIEQTVGRNTNEDLLDVKDKEDRIVVNASSYENHTESKGEVVGYSDQVEAVYGFMDKNYDNGMRLGFGLEAIRSDSSYDDDSGRYNNVIEAFVPIVFDSEALTALVKPKAGFARGHYRRVGVENTFKAKTKEYYYGVDAAIKQNYDLGWFEVEPMAEVDVTGMYVDDINESNDGLKIRDNNMLSAQSVLSLQAKKKLKLNSHSAFTFGAGGKYIHEFGDDYKNKARVSDMIGYYDIIGNRITRDYGILNTKAQFDYRDLTLDASANVPIGNKQKTYYIFNAKYRF